MTRTPAPSAPRARILDDIERDDNARGLEPDDDAAFHRLVQHLVADGDRRARLAGRRARRTLAEQAPDHGRRLLLTVGRPVSAAEDACPICGYWRCRCVNAGSGAALPASGAGR
ncbi:hypothetical protein [Streptomyces sp. DH12]|uniref:hypothetical protein n=1 Tax=Streptomyces sp. DH12 TaxID=2857010 RepID=UPI001E479466|nr:hypothetical protein [Streptomyces sp. DH12]